MNWYLANFGQDEDLTQFEEQQHSTHIPQLPPLGETFVFVFFFNQKWTSVGSQDTSEETLHDTL